LGLASSLRPTSSNASSSMRSGRLKSVDRIEGELRRQKRESRDVREGAASTCITGERAEMSWKKLVWGLHSGNGHGECVQMTGGRNRMIRGIWRRAHSHRPGHDGLWIALSRGIGARSFVFQGARAMRCQSVSLLLPGPWSHCSCFKGLYRKINAAIVHDYRTRKD
jgi:hypothetical protein